MKSSKVRQRIRSIVTATGLVVIGLLIAVVISLSLALNNTKVQRSLFQKYAKPLLDEYSISADFKGFTYTFPNSISIHPTVLKYEGEEVLRIDSLVTRDVFWNDGALLIGDVALQLSSNLNVQDSTWFDIMNQFGGDSSTGEISIPLRIGHLYFAVDSFNYDSLNFGLNLRAEEVNLMSGVVVSKVNSNLSSPWGFFTFQLDSTSYVEARFSSTIETYLDSVGEVKSAFFYSTDSIKANIKGEVYKSLKNSELEFLNQDVKDLIAGSEFIGSINQFGDLWLGEFSIGNELLSAEGHAEFYEGSEQVSTYLDASLFHPFYNLPMLKKVEGVWDYFKPAMLSAEIQTDFKEELLLSIDAREGRNRFSARSTSFEEPLRMELDLPKVRVGPVQGLALRAALVPGLGPLIRSEKISVNGVVPTLFSNGNEVNGLSFSVAHSNVKDSIYITCLDSLLDLEGSVELDSLGFKGDFLVNALGIGLFDTANADVVFSSDINLQSNYKGEGTLILKDVLISRPIESVFLSSFIASHFYDSGQRSLTVNSDVMQVNMVGAWDIEDLIPMSDLVLLSLSGQDSRRAWPYANLDIEAQFGDVQWLISLLHLPFKLPEGGIIEGRINGKKEGWQLVAAVPKLESDGLSLRGFKGQVSYALGHVSGSANLDEFHLGTWDLVDLGAKWIPATVGNGIQFRGVVVDSIPSDVKIEGSYGDGWGQMEQASFNVGLDEFKLSAPGRVEWSDDRIKFESIEFARESSKFKINGGLNSKNDMQLKLALENINSGTLNYLLRDPNLLLSGRLNANLKISGTFESTYAIGSLDWTDFGINNHKYGSIKGDFRWDENKDDLFLQTTVGTLSKTPLRLRGHYMPERDELDLALTADAFDIDPFGSYVAGTIDEIQGLLSGGVAIYGPLKEWKMEGGFALKSAHIKVPLVGAELVSKNEVNLRLTETEIILDSSILVHPVQQSPAVVWGKITHDRFDKIKFDLKLHTDSLLGLDLNRSYDSYFYGKALVGGDLWLDGPLERLHMDVKLETKEGTHFKIPLDNPTAIETPTFMRFVSSELATNEDSTNTILAQEYFTTDIDITATKEAQIDLVLDEVLGDVIKAKGEGNLRMKILEDESFELYGLYKVVEGNYLFTLQNIINKQFELVPGGTILWSGDLYDADLNLQAKYALSTDLGGLITNPSYRNENVDVDLIIELTGALMAPNISFRVELPNSPPSYQEELDRRILNEDAMNYQAFSLLMLGKFYQQNLGVQESINFYGTVSKSTSEVLVSQFGSWITAGLGNYVDIELDYTTGSNPYNTLTTTSDEIKLGVSKDFLDGRLRINSSVDVPVSQNGNSTLLLGDTQIEYELTKDGRVLLKAFNRSNRNDPLMQSSGPYTQGVGIQFTKDFEKTGILKP